MTKLFLIISVPLIFSLNIYCQTIPVENYELVWSDEFNYDTLDLKKWSHRYPGPRRNAINSPNAVGIHPNGHLTISTIQTDSGFITGMISTSENFRTTYGYFETRVLFQKQPGHWSAFWLQSPTKGKKIGNVEESGAEIDIFEYKGNQRKKIQHALHWDGYGKHLKSTSKSIKNKQLRSGWHIIGLLWTPEEYIFYINGEETWRMKEAISQRPQYIILSVEVSDWAGKIKRATLPDSVYFDYVRVYQPIPTKK